jgi:hypothetical protein
VVIPWEGAVLGGVAALGAAALAAALAPAGDGLALGTVPAEQAANISTRVEDNATSFAART